jgi:QueT transporter
VKLDSKDLALAAVSASLYAVVNVVQTSMGGPITYGPIQLRLADCLIPLSALFGWPLVIGVAIGCFSNAYYWLDPADVVVGPLVNLAAALIIFALRRHRVVACVSGGLTVGVPIGSYLYYLYTQGNPIILQQVPSFSGFSLPVWAAFVLSLSISSLIVIGLIGYVLLTALTRHRVVEPLKSHGLKVLAEGN